MRVFIHTVIIYFSFAGSLASAAGSGFEIERITERIYTAHPVGPISRINSTSTIIVADTYLIVVESQPDQSLAKELIAAIREKISTLPIRYLIFTHFHLDHILGATAFQKENPSVIILAHKNVAAYIQQNATEDKKQWTDFLKLRAEQTRQEALITIDQNRKSFLEKEAQVLSNYCLDVNSSPLISPTLAFTDSLTIYDQSLTLKLIHMGTGHTSSDIVIHIPEQKALITGDLVHNFEPLFGHANPDNWISILEKIKTIDCQYLIGGHGNAYHDKEIINRWLAYITELREKTIAAIQKGISLDDFKKSITQKSFISLTYGSFGQSIQEHRMALMTDRFIGTLDDAIRGEVENLWTFYGGKK